MGSEKERKRYLEMVQRHLQRLYNFVRRELAYFQATGELLPGELTPQEVIDAVVVRGYQEFNRRPASLSIDRWLLKLALEQITTEIKRVKTMRREALSLEGSPPHNGEGGGDEIYEFYQPDEKLRLEDILPAPEVPTPEQVVENRELQRYINQTLAQLPRMWRIVFMLHHVEDFSIPDIALVTGLDPTTVERYLEYTRAFLQQKMLEVLSEEAVGSGETTHRFFATAVEVGVPESLRTRVQTQILESQAS